MTTQKYAVRTLEKALKIYSLSMNETKMGEYIAEKCEDLGYDSIEIDDVGNVIAIKEGKGPTIVICGHMDVVPGKIKVRNINGVLYGRGASDAKAPLISMMLAGASMENCKIVFIGAVDEEGNATGIKNLLNRNFGSDYVIFGEPSGTGKITIGYKGRLGIKMQVAVKDSSHASAPWLSGNAILEATNLADLIKSDIECDSTNGTKLTVTITSIYGGSSHNVTPLDCEFTLDVRIPTNMNCADVESDLDKIINKFEKSRSVKVIYSITDETEPFEANGRSILVNSITMGAKEHGIDIKLVRKTGTGDMNVVGNRWGNVCTYGPGDPHLSHTVNESIKIDEYLLGIEVLKSSLNHLVRIHERIKTKNSGNYIL